MHSPAPASSSRVPAGKLERAILTQASRVDSFVRPIGKLPDSIEKMNLRSAGVSFISSASSAKMSERSYFETVASLMIAPIARRQRARRWRQRPSCPSSLASAVILASRPRPFGRQENDARLARQRPVGEAARLDFERQAVAYVIEVFDVVRADPEAQTVQSGI